MNSTTVRINNRRVIKVQGNKVLPSYNKKSYSSSTEILKNRNISNVRERINTGTQVKTRTRVRENVNTKEKVESNFNVKVLMKYFLIFMIITSLSLYKVMLGYNVSQLQQQKSILTKELNDKKLTLKRMEERYMSLFDIKKVQERSLERGFVYNDKIEYLKK